jgi:aspartyl/asparaginyl-tRNA synthetase
MIRTPRILVADLHSHVGETVSIAGWAQTLRLQRAVQFVIVRDHTGAAQITHRRDGTALEESLAGLSVESAVRVTGRVVANPVVALGGIELIPDQVTVESHAEAPLPIDASTGPEGRLDWRFLDEITTGAQREHRYDVLVAQAAEKGLSPEPMRDYLNNFRYGCPPHGGFGLGLGRLLMTLPGLDSIRDATFLFRGPNRLTP